MGLFCKECHKFIKHHKKGQKYCESCACTPKCLYHIRNHLRCCHNKLNNSDFCYKHQGSEFCWIQGCRYIGNYCYKSTTNQKHHLCSYHIKYIQSSLTSSAGSRSEIITDFKRVILIDIKYFSKIR